MEKTNKVIRIVLSIVTFVCIALFAVALFALPIKESVNSGVRQSVTIYGFIRDFIEEAKNISQMGGQYAVEHIGLLFSLVLTVVFTFVFGIIALVKGIALLVKTIKGMSGQGELPSVLKSLLAFGLVLFVYVALLFATLSVSKPGSVTELGSGPEMMLSASIVSLVVVGVYRIATKDDRKLVNKILGFGTSMFAIIGILLAFSYAFSGQGNFSKYGLFGPVLDFIKVISSETAPEPSVLVGYVLAVVGIVIALVGLGMSKSVIANGFSVESKDKKLDFEKSSIVKSSVWLGLFVIGFVLAAVGLRNTGLSLGAGAIVGIVMAALALATAIVNKVLANKFAEPKTTEAKAE